MPTLQLGLALPPPTPWTALILACLLLVLYIRTNDRKLLKLPPEASAYSPERFTEERVRRTAEELKIRPVTVLDRLPPKTGRRYIVVGGGGFLGGCIVRHLIQRGEDPRQIRVLDIRIPSPSDLESAELKLVDYRKVDISDPSAVLSAFTSPWPPTVSSSSTAAPAPLTVFHTASTIRFYERHPALLHRSSHVNVLGTQNILAASRAAGVTTLVYTSSGSVSVRSSRFLLWPWEPAPDRFVQVLDDADADAPRTHREFFSNYAASKMAAERLVRAANDKHARQGGLRTGCIRPGNGIYGVGDVMCDEGLVRRRNVTWIQNVCQSFVAVENCSLAHLCYEARLNELHERAELDSGRLPDVSGDAFCVTDAGPPVTYGDTYLASELLTSGQVSFTLLSPTAMLLLAHVFEFLYLSRALLLSSPRPLYRLLGRLVPQLKGQAAWLQPSLFNLTMVHLVFDSSRAMKAPEEGGLGYKPAWTTLQGMCRLVEERKKVDAAAATKARVKGEEISGRPQGNEKEKGVMSSIGVEVQTGLRDRTQTLSTLLVTRTGRPSQ